MKYLQETAKKRLGLVTGSAILALACAAFVSAAEATWDPVGSVDSSTEVNNEGTTVLAGWLLLVSLQAVCGAPPEARTWTSRGDQKTMEAEYAGLANGKVSLRLANKRLTQVPLEKISDADQEYVKSQLGKLRDWTAAKSGKKATAQFVQLTEKGMVELLMEDHKAVMLPRASLVAADQKYLDTEAPIPLIRRLSGSWTGHSYGGGYEQFVHRMDAIPYTATPGSTPWNGLHSDWVADRTGLGSWLAGLPIN